MKDTIIIPFSRKKKQKNQIYLGFFLFLLLGIIVSIISIGDINWFVLGVVIAIFAVGVTVFIRKRIEISILNKKNEGLELTPEYLKNNTSIYHNVIGEIPWIEIDSIHRMSQLTYKGILRLKLKSPEKYAAKINNREEASSVYWGILIDNNELDITFEELERLINEYFAKYGNS